MDVMCLFFHACSFSEIVMEREVNCYYICTSVILGLRYLILVGFSLVLMYFSVCSPAVKAFEIY